MASEHNREPEPSVRAMLSGAIGAALDKLGIRESAGDIQIERPNDPGRGDLSSNIAMAAAKRLGGNPRELAGRLKESIVLDPDFIDRVEVAGPGFLNFAFSKSWLTKQVEIINVEGRDYGRSEIGRGKRIQVEYVSANPTGPLVIVAARAAAVGSALVNILRKTGHEVESEYYLNDAGSQVRKLGVSLMTRFMQRIGRDVPFPEDGYPGGYLVEIAGRIPEDEGRLWLAKPPDESASSFGEFALDQIIRWIRRDLDGFGVVFDNYFRESALHAAGGGIDRMLEIFKSGNAVYEDDGALWFRSTGYGDEKDRVLVRSDGTPTYFLADAAYHLDKFRRGYSRVIDIFGPDHHGHIARLKAAAAVFGAPDDWLDVMTVQWVRLVEDGRQVKMSKRGGEFETLGSLVEDVGGDASKFFFLQRKINAHLDFNLTLARKSSDENPVYYVQYAHARICSVIAFAREAGVTLPEEMSCVSLLGEPEELELIRNLVIFPHLVEGAAESCEPHRLTGYAQQLAASFHRFYHICRIVSSDERLSQARLLLAEASRIVLSESLGLLGVSAPDRM